MFVVGATDANVEAIDGAFDFGEVIVEIDAVQDPAAEQMTEQLGAGFDDGDLLSDLAAEAVVDRAGAPEWQVALVSATGHRGILAHPKRCGSVARATKGSCIQTAHGTPRSRDAYNLAIRFRT